MYLEYNNEVANCTISLPCKGCTASYDGLFIMADMRHCFLLEVVLARLFDVRAYGQG